MLAQHEETDNRKRAGQCPVSAARRSSVPVLSQPYRNLWAISKL
jgi:hypothetical protein